MSKLRQRNRRETPTFQIHATRSQLTLRSGHSPMPFR